MQTFTKYRGTHRLVTNEVSKVVIQIIRETPEAGDHEIAALERMAEVLREAGLGVNANDSSGQGYLQILALLSAMLLRLGGANVDAAANAVVGKSSSDLERLSEAILGRMRKATAGKKPAIKRLCVDSSAESAIKVQRKQIARTSTPGMLSPYAADPSVDNPAIAYLREQCDDDLQRKVRNLVLTAPKPPLVSPRTPVRGIAGEEADWAHPEDPLMDSGSVTVARSTPAPITPVRLDVAEGVALSMSITAVGEHNSGAKRAELIRALAAALNSFYADEA